MSCPRDTNGDGDCGQRYCPDCGIPRPDRLRADDEELIAAATEWAKTPVREHRKAIMVLTDYNHARAVIQQLGAAGWQKFRSDHLQWPSGDTLHVRTSGNMMSGVMVDEVFIHPNCPERVRDALARCVRR